MDVNREEHRHSEDLGELELSLGLGLSSGDSRQKGPPAATASSPASSDLLGEPSSGSTLNGSHSSAARHKPSNNKASGLEAALKKFLEGRLDEQDENSKLLDGSSSFNQEKEKEKPMLPSSHGSNKQPDLLSNIETKGNPFIFKELQVSMGLGTSKGCQSSAHTTPLQLVDAFKASPMKSGSGGSPPPSVYGVGNPDGKDTVENIQETLDQHGKLQEAEKKRKHLIEEQKHQKKGKKEDEKAESRGFWKPGWNTWVQGLDANADNKDCKRLQQEASRDNESGDAESDGVDGPDMAAPNAGANLGPKKSRGPSGDQSKGMEVNFMSHMQEQSARKKEPTNHNDDTWHLATVKKSGSVAAASLQVQGGDRSFKGIISVSPNSQKEAQASLHAMRTEGEKAPLTLQRQREKVPSETSTASTDGTEKMDEKSRGGGIGEASSSTLELGGGTDKAMPVVSAVANPSHPFPMTPFSMVSMPYSLPMSIPHAAGGMPFAAPVNFPYLMQYLPPGSDGQDQNLPMRPILGNIAYHPPPGMEYLAPQCSPFDGSSWMHGAAFRPSSAMASFTNATNGSLYARGPMGVPKDANNRLQAPKVPDQGGGVQNADASLLGNHPFFRIVANNSTHDLAGPSCPIPAIPHFSSQLTVPDQGEPHSFKDQGGGGGTKPFPGFPATFQAAGASLEGPVRRPPVRSGGAKDDEGLEPPRFGGTNDNPMFQQGPLRSAMEPSNMGALGGHFHQGSTENLSAMDGEFGEDMSYLKRGIAPGLKFGGTGMPPDLPWVYTVGKNGQAVSGVVYRLNRNQLRVVCACHGKHMSPPEFAQHAESADISGGERNTPNSSPLRSQAN